jgi:hypothetical protein
MEADTTPEEALTMARPTVLDVYPLLDEYAALEQNSNGGSLHIVLMDGNLRSSHVRFCRDWAAEHDDDLGVRLALALLDLTETQRGECARYFNEKLDEERP